MAEGTRLKDLQESLKKLDQLLQTESMKRAASELKIQEQMAGIDKKYEHLTTTLADIQLQLLNLGKGTGSGEGSVLGNYEKSFGFGKHGSNPNFAHSPLPIIDFPRFDGSNPRGWILKCNSYFKLIPGILDSHKVNLATMHFDGKALSWFQNLNMDQFDITWEQFLEVVSARFEDMRVSNIIVEFNKLKHTDSYDDYVEHFNELKACMVLGDQSKYSEDYFIASFVSGLSEELRSFIHMFQPKTLHQTIELGRKQLTTLEAITKRLLPSSQPYHNPPNTYKKTETLPNLPSVPALDSNTKSNSPPIKLLTSAEMAARRDKGLCYNCDEKYVFGHRCTKRVNYVMMTETEELIASKEFADLELQEVETNMVQHIDEVHISLHSIMGEGGITTMRVVGEVGLHKLDILLDTGSTLSFINETTKHVQRTVEENADFNIPSTSYALVPLKFNGVKGAGRRSGNLEKRPLKDRSSESNMVAVRQKSTFQLTPSMLRGQALRSMEEASTSELLHSVQDDHNIEASAGFMDADDHTSQDQGKVEEDGPVENAFPSDTHYPINNSDSAVSFEADIVRGRTSDDLEVGLSEPQNKAAFRMSALEDYVDLDDDLPNEVALRSPSEEREPFVAHLKNSKFSPLEEPKRSEACSEPELKSPSDLILSKSNEASTAVAVSLGERSNGIINPTSEEVTAAAPLSIPPPSVAALDKPKEIPQSVFSFSPKVADKFPSLMPESNSRTLESSSSLVDVFAPTSSSVIVPESERGGFLKPLALAAEDTNGKCDSVTSAASNGLLVSVAPFGSFTATSNNNTHQISTSPVIFTPSVTVSDSIPSGNGSITSDPSSKVSFRTSETPKVSGEPPFKFGISSNPSTTASEASTIIPAGDMKNNGVSDPSAGNSTSSSKNLVAFGFPSSGNVTSGLSSFNSNPSDNNSQGSLFSSASKSLVPAFGTFSDGPYTQSNSFAPLPSSNANSTTSFVSSLSSAQVSSQITPFGFNASASSSDTGAVASSSGPTSSLFGVNPHSVSDSSAGGSSNFTTPSVFSFGLNSYSSSGNAVGSAALVSSSSGSDKATTGSFSSSSSPTFAFGAVGSTGAAAAPVFSFGASSSGSASVITASFSSSSSTSAVASTSGAAPSTFSFGMSNPASSASGSTTSFSNGAFNFGGSSSASSTAINSDNAPPNPFGSSLQAPTHSMFGSSPATGFSFGASAATSQPTNAAAPVTFNSFSSAPASVFPSPSPSLSQPVFGNNFQMNGEDSMAEDPVQSTAPTPSLPAFGQPNASPSPPGFMFGSTTVQPQANPFQFGGQQNNQGAPQNPSVFQASGSLGGSFSLGSGGGDKSGRKFVKANRNKNRKK